MISLDQYIELFKNRVQRLDLALNLNELAILNYINKARIDVQNRILPYAEEYYTDILVLPIKEVDDTQERSYTKFPVADISLNRVNINRYLLPNYIIDIKAIYIKDSNKNIIVRITSQEEFLHAITHQWIHALSVNPIAFFEKDVQMSQGYVLYIAGIRPPLGYNNEDKIILYITKVIPLLSYTSLFNVDYYDYNTPLVFVNMVLDRAIIYYLNDMVVENALQINPQLLAEMEQSYEYVYSEEFIKENLLIPSKEEVNG